MKNGKNHWKKSIKREKRILDMITELPFRRVYRNGPADWSPETNMTRLDVDQFRKYRTEQEIFTFLMHERDHRILGKTHYIFRMGVFDHEMNNRLFDFEGSENNFKPVKELVYSLSTANNAYYYQTYDIMEAASAFYSDLDIEYYFDISRNLNPFKISFIALHSLVEKIDDEIINKSRPFFDDVVKTSLVMRDSVLRKSRAVRDYYDDLKWLREQTKSFVIPYFLLGYVLNAPMDDMRNEIIHDTIRERFQEIIHKLKELDKQTKLSSNPIVQKLNQELDTAFLFSKLDKSHILKIYKFFEEVSRVKGSLFYNSGFRLHARRKEGKNNTKHDILKLFVNIPFGASITKGRHGMSDYLKFVGESFYQFERSSNDFTLMNPFVIAKIDNEFELMFHRQVPLSIRKLWATNWLRSAIKNKMLDEDYDFSQLLDIKYRDSSGTTKSILSLVRKNDMEKLEELKRLFRDTVIPDNYIEMFTKTSPK